MKFDIHFLGLPWEIVFGVFTDIIISIALEKCEKECNIVYIILVQGFCPLKIEITQFPDEFWLKFMFQNMAFLLLKVNKFSQTMLVLNAFPAISEDFNLKIFRGRISPDPPGGAL